MITHSKYHPRATADQTAPDVSEQHHGDLRKRAYLKRRAAYQMQADSGTAPRQAGSLPVKNRDPS